MAAEFHHYERAVVDWLADALRPRTLDHVGCHADLMFILGNVIDIAHSSYPKA